MTKQVIMYDSENFKHSPKNLNEISILEFDTSSLNLDKIQSNFEDIKDKYSKMRHSLSVANRELAKDLSVIGSIVYFPAGTSPGDSWVLCDGRNLTRNSYPEFFDALNISGDTYYLSNLAHADVGKLAWFSSDMVPEGWLYWDDLKANINKFPKLKAYLKSRTYPDLNSIPKIGSSFIANYNRDAVGYKDDVQPGNVGSLDRARFSNINHDAYVNIFRAILCVKTDPLILPYIKVRNNSKTYLDNFNGNTDIPEVTIDTTVPEVPEQVTPGNPEKGSCESSGKYWHEASEECYDNRKTYEQSVCGTGDYSRGSWNWGHNACIVVERVRGENANKWWCTEITKDIINGTIINTERKEESKNNIIVTKEPQPITAGTFAEVWRYGSDGVNFEKICKENYKGIWENGECFRKTMRTEKAPTPSWFDVS